MKSKKGSRPLVPNWDLTVDAAVGMMRLDGLTSSYRNALWIVIAITGVMFLLEMVAGHIYGSHVLQVDALDFLDDMLTYILSLAVIGASTRLRAAVAFLKAFLLCLTSLWILCSSIYHLFFLEATRAEIIGAVGFLAVLANVACLALLAPHTSRDKNIRADGLSCRHDITGNVAVVFVALSVWFLQSPWPDLFLAIAASGQWVFIAGQMLRHAVRQYRASGTSSIR